MTTPADPPLPGIPHPETDESLPLFKTENGLVWRACVSVAGDDETPRMRPAHLSALLAALPEETRNEILKPFVQAERVMHAYAAAAQYHQLREQGERTEDERQRYLHYAKLLESERAEHEKTTARGNAMVIEWRDRYLSAAERREEFRAERDALAAKLEKAMAVVDAAVANKRNQYDCYTAVYDSLVAQGFIDRDGRRLETAGKEGA